MKKLLLICLIATVITGCANEALIKETQSGKAEAEYPNYTQEQVIDAIVQYCNGKGFSIEEQQKNFVICSKQMTGGAAIFTQMAIGNSYTNNRQTESQIMRDTDSGITDKDEKSIINTFAHYKIVLIF